MIFSKCFLLCLTFLYLIIPPVISLSFIRYNGYKIYDAKDFASKRNPRANFGLIDLVSPTSNYSKAQTRSSIASIIFFG